MTQTSQARKARGIVLATVTGVLAAVLVVGGPLAASAVWTEYFYGTSTKNYWKISTKSYYTGGAVWAVTFPGGNNQYVETRSDLGTAGAYGAVAYTHQRIYTTERCRWTYINGGINTAEIGCEYQK